MSKETYQFARKRCQTYIPLHGQTVVKARCALYGSCPAFAGVPGFFYLKHLLQDSRLK
ncbi:hypothetical protein [Treponema parvum]|uniref:hypothetical protein n=1 Tax=Treponema parvum TaxID=138851 RepID=UPI001AEBCFD0|nr:hypothetical protein [Treponema parvum]QTQ16087.1 hypothetical protein HXT04_04910 [Treponema parvum]